MKKVVCFGEIMLRLNPEGYLRVLQAERFMASFAGGEANVAVSLANYGVPVAFVTKLPNNEIGQSALNPMRRFGVDTGGILRGGERLGVYFIEKGASQRPTKVIYDRKGSSVAEAEPEEYDWKKLFQDAGWFRFTGITPALSAKAAQCCMDACKTAKEMGLTVSCDLNYRKNLWSKDQAKKTMETLIQYVNVCIANEEDAADVFGINASGTDVNTGKISHEGYAQVVREIAQRYGCKQVAITLRGSRSANDNDWAGMLYDGSACVFSKSYSIHIVDRVGGGDSFGGGLIYALHTGKSAKDAIEFAVAASCLKHSIEYDFNMMTVDEVERLAGGDGSGRVQR